jgi:phage shock protein PspC (stress-responsive transcriptional regulator)
VTEVFRRAPDVAWVDRGDRVIALRLADLSLEPLALEHSAADVWRTVADDGTELTGVVAEVAELYGVEPTVVRADVSAFLAQAVDAGIMERTTS